MRVGSAYLPIISSTLQGERLGGQPLEGQSGSRDHMTQGVYKQIGILTPIESKRHFFAVGLKMLCTESMPRTNNAALQKRECGFDGVGIDVALCINVELVPNRFVPSILPKMLRRTFVRLKVIREKDIHVLADVFSDVLLKGAALYIFRVEKSEVAATLTDSDYDFFVVMQRGFPFEPILSAYECFIHFNLSAQHSFVDFDHRCTDAMAQIPRSFVADSKRALNVTGRHALLRFTHQQRSEKPFRQWQMRIIKNRSCGHAELVVTILAIVE